jgi:hypothetical protein
MVIWPPAGRVLVVDGHHGQRSIDGIGGDARTPCQIVRRGEHRSAMLGWRRARYEIAPGALEAAPRRP